MWAGNRYIFILMEALGESSALLEPSDQDKALVVSWASIWDELKVLALLAAPTIVQGAAQQGMLFTDQV